MPKNNKKAYFLKEFEKGEQGLEFLSFLVEMASAPKSESFNLAFEIKFKKLLELERTEKLMNILENADIPCLEIKYDPLYLVSAIVIIGSYLKRNALINLTGKLIKDAEEEDSLEAKQTICWIVSTCQIISGDSREKILKTLKITEIN